MADNTFVPVDGLGLLAQYGIKQPEPAGPQGPPMPTDAQMRGMEASEIARKGNEAEPGRYEVIPENKVEDWQKQWREKEASSGLGGDAQRLVRMGANSMLLGVREAVRSIPKVGPSIVGGLDAIDKWATGKDSETILKENVAYHEARLTPEMQAARKKEFVTETKTPDGKVQYGMGPAWTDPRTYAAAIFESAAPTAASMIPGGVLARGAYMRAIAGGASKEAAAAAAARAALIGGAVSEGIIGGGQTAYEVREQINKLPEDVLATSEAYQELLKAGKTPQEARAAIADDAAVKGLLLAGTATAMFGGQGDRVLAKLIAEGTQGGLGKRILAGAARGAVAEGVLEELPQSVGEKLAENYAMQGADPRRTLTEGVPNAAVSGAITGGIMGAGFGGAGGAASQAEPPAVPKGPLRQALDYGIEKANERDARATGIVPPSAPPAAPPVQATGPTPPDAGLPGAGESVMVQMDDGSTFPARVETYSNGEVIVADAMTGELLQVPPSALRLPTPEQYAAARAAQAGTPEPEPPTETTVIPNTGRTVPVEQAIDGPPEAGKNVIVTQPDGTKATGRVGGYTIDEATGEQAALVKTPQGELQVPLSQMAVSSMSKKEIAREDAKLNPPVQRDIPATPTMRKVGRANIEMPDEIHARLYDLGKARVDTAKMLGKGTMDRDRVSPAEQAALSQALGVAERELGQIADDYRYRVDRTARTANSDLPIKMQPVNAKLLERKRAESAKAAEESEKGTVESAPASDVSPAAPAPIDEAAKEAATSPTNDTPQPTEAQKEAGNYKKGHVRLAGLDISIENPQGSTRSGTDKSGKAWSIEMKSHYGYIKGTKGKDKDHLDVFIRPGVDAVSDDAMVYVIDQRNPGGQFDEHKIMIGFTSIEEAERAYLANYSKGWKGLGDITEITMGELKAWLASGDTTKPFAARAGQPPAQDRATWWNNDLTGAGRRMIMEAARVQLPATVRWQSIRPAIQQLLWNQRAAAEQASGSVQAEKTQPPPISEVVEKAGVSANPAPKAPPAAEKTEPVKWFGARDRAEAYMTKKKLAGSHEIVEASKGRFEVRPKASVEPRSTPPVASEPADRQARLNEQGATAREENQETEQRARADAERLPGETDPAYFRRLREQQQDNGSAGIYWRIMGEKLADMVTDFKNIPVFLPKVRKADISVAKTPLGWTWGASLQMSNGSGRSSSAGAYPADDRGYLATREDAIVAAVSLIRRDLVRDMESTSESDTVRRIAENAIVVLDELTDNMMGNANWRSGNANRQSDQAAPPAETPAPSPAAAEAKPADDQFAKNTLFTADKVAAARARLRAKMNQLNSGVDPEVLIDGMTIAGAYIESGIRSFAEYAAKMKADFGDSIVPYLLSFWEGARNYPGLDTAGMTPAEESRAQHAKLMSGADLTEVKPVIGETAAKPEKRKRKTGASSDMVLTQDWGVEHIDGYGTSPNRETGNETKDAFLRESRSYLNQVMAILTDRGYQAHADRGGKLMKPVSVNEAGPAVSGEVSLTMFHPDGGGVYVQIGASSLRGVVPTTPSGVAIMYRRASEKDRYGSKGVNRWAPVDLSAADFAELIDREGATAVAGEPRRGAPAQAPVAATLPQAGAEPAQGVMSDLLAPPAARQEVRNDARADETDPAGRDQGSGAGSVQPVASDGATAPAGQSGGGRTDGVAGVGQGGTARGREDARQPVLRADDAAPASQPRDGDAVTRGDRTGTGAVRPAGESSSDDAAPPARPNRPVSAVGQNHRIEPGAIKRTGSWRDTAERNVEIVELVKRLEAEGRRPTPDEAALLTRFTGWGASEIANSIFGDRNGQFKPGWEGIGARLKAALTPEEYAQAKRTTQYAHYTGEDVIRPIYTALERMGFTGGRVLEPGMGVGLFNGLMPAGMASGSRYTGIEFDTITGSIAKLLYPQSDIIVGDYTKTALPRDYFDLAIGNPPFGSIVISNDPEYKKNGFMIHDYFFAKTIDRVKPGGLLVFVTSKGTMDKANDVARRYLAARANLVGAIRLPQTAFQQNAGTEVVTDIIFLQKRGDGVEDNGVAWKALAEVDTPSGKTPINQYFAANPQMVLGRHAMTGSMYRAETYTVEPDKSRPFEDQIADAVARLPESIVKVPTGNAVATEAAVIERDYNPKIRKEGGLYLSDDGALMVLENGAGVPMKTRTMSDGKTAPLKDREIAFLSDWVNVRDALKVAYKDQLTDGPWEASLAALRKTYDAFVAKHGRLREFSTIERTDADGEVTVSKRYKNDPLLRLDVEGVLAHALEKIDEVAGTISPDKVLSERVLEKRRPPEIKTVQDALFVSLDAKGALVIDDVARLAGVSREDAISTLGAEIYQTPTGTWETADRYLSGDVRKKLKDAQAAAALDRRFARNVEGLLAVQPRPLGPAEISVSLGQNWIAPQHISDFANEVMGERLTIRYLSKIARWTVDAAGRTYGEYNTPKMSAADILDAVLNNREIKVTERDSEGKTHVDTVSTEAAIAMATKMKEAFRSWVWTDKDRADELVNFYNENFNNIAPRKFDGSHLTLPGVTSRLELRPHQKRAIWRAVQEGDTYLAHAVGAGKTYTMIASGMEERRLGLSTKPMYVVPNHMLAQFSREFLELYPAANIMVADEQNFHTGNRRRFIAQAALNNPDAIIITHSAFGRLPMSDEFSARFIEGQIAEWQDALADVDKSDRITLKQIQRQIEQLERRLEARQGDKEKKDRVMTFEELGVDRLFVDEGHEFRKLDFPTNQGRIKGIDPAGSQRAMDLHMKVQYLRKKKPGRALVMASGTPITNTMGELFTVQRLFQPDQLAEDNHSSFDAWANHYGAVASGFEQNAAGGYEIVARFAKFMNVPELMRRVRSFMDILTSADLGALVKRPNVRGGGRDVIVTDVPDGYKQYQASLQSRIAAIKARKGKVQKGDDIILSVIADGRFSAIDMRFVDPRRPSDPKSKLNRMIDDVIAAYKATADNVYYTDGQPDPLKGSSILLFSDIGLGEQSAQSRGFDMRAWIEKRLADAGIPSDHIAFMRDHKAHAKKERLFADMREGKKRILIGGKDMETGVNVQKRLAWLGHLDAPWFPASVEQREGRIIRQGNQNTDITIKAYATKGSYDSTMWGMNARKARFIEQAMTGDETVRSLEDVSEASAFEVAAALASGDERYLKMAGLKADYERLERLAQAHHDDQRKLSSSKHTLQQMIAGQREEMEKLEKALERRQVIRPGAFEAKIGGTVFDNRDQWSDALFKRAQVLIGQSTVTEKGEKIGEIGGFPVLFKSYEVIGSYRARVDVDAGVPTEAILIYPFEPELAVNGLATKAANIVNSLDRRLEQINDSITDAQRKIKQIDDRLGAPFPEQAAMIEKFGELQALQAELAAEKAAEGAAMAEAAAAAAEVEAPVVWTIAPERKFSIANPAFKRWFGNSKVVDAQGKPLVVYHGTDAPDFDVFKPGQRFSEDASESSAYTFANQLKKRERVAGKYVVRQGRDLAGRTLEYSGIISDIENAKVGEAYATDQGVVRYLGKGRWEVFSDLVVDNQSFDQSAFTIKVKAGDATKAARGLVSEYEAAVRESYPGGNGGRVYAAYLSIKNPVKLGAFEANRIANRLGMRDPEIAAVIAKYEAQGYDGIETTSDEATAFPELSAAAGGIPRQWIAFRPEQIKSATGNQGTFDPADPRITFSTGAAGQPSGNPGQLRAELTSHPLGRLVAPLIESGRVSIVDGPVAGVPATAHGWTEPDGTIVLRTNIPRGDAMAVLMHEAFHAGARGLLGRAEWTALMRSLRPIYRQMEGGTGKAKAFHDAFMSVRNAEQAEGRPMTEAQRLEEFAAYAIENREAAPRSLAIWIDNLLGQVKAWVLRTFGRQAGAVTPGQLRAIAIMAVRDMAHIKDQTAKGGRRYAIAYHGTPHAFDRFSLEGIGSGEGNQSFGWGLYFASNKEIANHYRKKLSALATLPQGNELRPGEHDISAWVEYVSDAVDNAKMAKAFGVSVSSAEFDQRLDDAINEAADLIMRGRTDRAPAGSDEAVLIQNMRDAGWKFATAGSLYTVKVPDEDQLLDWEKPLSEQPPKVRAALATLNVDLAQAEADMTDSHYELTGEMLYNWMEGEQEGGFGSDKAASMALLAAGIPGIRYMDSNQRRRGVGGHNYVIFDDTQIEVQEARRFSIAMPKREDAVRAVRGKLTDLTPAMLAAVPLNYFSELRRPSMTAVDQYLDIKRAMDTYRGNKHEAADKISQEWLDYSKLGIGADGKAKAAVLAELMHDSTLAGVDPSMGYDQFTDGVAPEAYEGLRARWNKLPAKAQALYETARDAYKAQSEEMDRIILANVKRAMEIAAEQAQKDYLREVDRIQRSKTMSPLDKAAALEDAKKARAQSMQRSQWADKARLTRLRAEFESTRMKGPYFPLARFGRYFVSAKDVDGEVLSFQRFENAADMDKAAEEMRALTGRQFPGATVEFGVLDEPGSMRQAMDPRLVAQVETILAGASVDPSVMDAIWQRYLMTLPEMSIRKRQIHRKGTAGFEKDALRVFSNHMFHAAHQMARMKYGLELQEALNKSSEQARTADDPVRASTLINEMRKRHEWVMNPTGGQFAQRVTSAMFAWYLAASPASALVNITQTAIVGLPVLGARLGGMGKATLAVMRAMGDFASGKGSTANSRNLSSQEKEAMAAFYESGLIDRTRSHDLAGVGNTGTEYSPLRHRIMEKLAWMFHQAEVLNREVTALAAYRLAREKGENHQTAINTAHELTWKTHFDYSNSNRPRIMQSDFAKVALVFQNFQINMWYRFFRDFHQSFKGETPAARREARYQLAGIMGMLTLLGGVSSIFGFKALMAIAGLLLDDEDDPRKFEEELKNAIMKQFGPDIGAMIVSGVPGRLMNIDLASRIGMPDFLIRTRDSNKEGREAGLEWMAALFGASASTVLNAFDGAHLISEGKVMRGIEVMAPKAIKDLMQAYRFANDGLENRRGATVMERDDLSFWDIASKGLGFTSGRISETYARNRELAGAERRVLEDRKLLIEAWATARMHDDSDARKRAMEKIAEFNQRPYARGSMRITAETLARSLAVRKRNDTKREDGVVIESKSLDRFIRGGMPERTY